MRAATAICFLLLSVGVAGAKKPALKPGSEILAKIRRAYEDQVAAIEREAQARAALATATTGDALAAAQLIIQSAQQALLAAKKDAADAHREMDAAQKAATLDLAHARLRALRAGVCVNDSSSAEMDLDRAGRTLDDALTIVDDLKNLLKERHGADLARAKADLKSANASNEAAQALVRTSAGTSAFYQASSWLEQTRQDLSAAEERFKSLDQMSQYGGNGDKLGQGIEDLSTKLEDIKSGLANVRLSIE